MNQKNIDLEDAINKAEDFSGLKRANDPNVLSARISGVS